MSFCPPGEKEKNTFEFKENLHSEKKRKKTPHSCDYEDSYNSSKSQTYSETELYTPLSTLFHCLDAKVEVGNQKECILKKKTKNSGRKSCILGARNQKLQCTSKRVNSHFRAQSMKSHSSSSVGSTLYA
mmetsp:Transcript_157433/g.286670  ORF Transcript_157433/g.286670 Transcript_157433/m.286670 type:complete len:129 (-) Transcript_157433:219-605(-)